MADNKIKVSLLQMDIACGDPKENFRRVEDLITQALKQRKKPDILVLPEMWNTGYDLKRIRDLADEEGAPHITRLQELAKKERINIVAGSIADKRPDPVSGETRVYNSSYIIDREGLIKARYDKVHRFSLMSEQKYFMQGSQAVTFELDDIPCGIIICYDLRFPELVRKLALMGAQVLFVPAQWPKPRHLHWKLLNIVRAIENQFYVVAVNRVGRDKNIEFPGLSMVINPWGEPLLECDDKPGAFSTLIDMNAIEHVRRYMPVFEDRRPETY